MKNVANLKDLEELSVRARVVRVWAWVREQASATRPPQTSTATCRGWDSVSARVHEVEQEHALGRARRLEPTVERSERL